jgi:hypothetical protein
VPYRPLKPMCARKWSDEMASSEVSLPGRDGSGRETDGDPSRLQPRGVALVWCGHIAVTCDRGSTRIGPDTTTPDFVKPQVRRCVINCPGPTRMLILALENRYLVTNGSASSSVLRRAMQHVPLLVRRLAMLDSSCGLYASDVGAARRWYVSKLALRRVAPVHPTSRGHRCASRRSRSR